MLRALGILIVDDQARARQSLKALLYTWFQFVDIYEAASGDEAIQCIERLNPDMVITDARMEEMDGVELTRAIKTRWPAIRVLVLSMYPEYRETALAAGADVFMTKDEPFDHLFDALVGIAKPEIVNSLILQFLKR